MDGLEFRTDKELITFFRHKKTEVVCMENPNLFLQLLRDHDLVPGDRFQERIKMESEEEREKVMYEILDSLEKKGQQSVREFWKCAFQDHIQKKYSVLRSFKQEILGGFGKSCEAQSGDEKPNMKEKKEEQKKAGTKRKISSDDDDEEEEEEEDESGFFFESPLKKAAMLMQATLSERNAAACYLRGDKRNPVSKKLIKGEECIRSQGRWFTPPEFQRFAGREKSKRRQRSIRYNNITLHELFQHSSRS